MTVDDLIKDILYHGLLDALRRDNIYLEDYMMEKGVHQSADLHTLALVVLAKEVLQLREDLDRHEDFLWERVTQ